MKTQSLKDPVSNFAASSQQQISSTTCKLLAKSPQLNQPNPYIVFWLQLSYTVNPAAPYLQPTSHTAVALPGSVLHAALQPHTPFDESYTPLH